MPKSSTMLPLLARGGYAARGTVYLIIGLFAALAAIGSAQPKGSEGALQTLLAQPFGTVLVAILVIGLLGFSGWRFVQSILDADHHGTDAKAIGLRIGLFGSAIAHLALAAFAAGLLIGWRLSTGGNGSGSDPTREWLSPILGQDWAWWLALGIAAILAIVGIAHVVKGWRAGFEKWLDADKETLDAVTPVCRFGLIARGAVFLVLAGMVFYARGAHEPSDTPGVQDALQAVQDMPAGWLILLVLAVGLIAFAAYNFVEAVYRRVSL